MLRHLHQCNHHFLLGNQLSLLCDLDRLSKDLLFMLRNHLQTGHLQQPSWLFNQFWRQGQQLMPQKL
jgi:hypothetical protein